MLTQAPLLRPRWPGVRQTNCKGSRTNETKSQLEEKITWASEVAQDPPLGGILPPAFPGYVTPEELTAMIQQRNQEQDDPSWGTVEDLKTKVVESDIDDITPYLGPVRAIVLFYGSRRRQGDVAHF